MRYLITIVIAALSLNAFGQGIPQLPYNPDENGDGVIGVADLQAFLSLYNTQFAAAVVNDGVAMLYLGLMVKHGCMTACNSLPGRWEVVSSRAVMTNYELFLNAIEVSEDQNSGSFWLRGGEADWNISPVNEFDAGSYDYYNSATDNPDFDIFTKHDHESIRCVCSISERPKIEYTRTSQDATIEEINQLTSEGWYIQSTTSSYIHFWRWAD